MSKNNALAKELPSMQSTFQIDVEGEVTKKRFLGEFSCKIMNRKEQAMVAKHKAYLNGELVDQLDLGTIRFHHQISYLRYALIDYPTFWKKSDLGYELYDANVVEAVYDAVLSFEEKWMIEVWGPEAVSALKDDNNEQEPRSAKAN